MTKLRNYLKEGIDYDKIDYDLPGYYKEVSDMIRKDCAPFLRESKDQCLWRRAIKAPSSYGFARRRVRQNRVPKNSSIKIHKQSDMVQLFMLFFL